MRRFGIISALVVITGSMFFPAQIASAQSAGAAQGLEISPALIELNAERGKTYSLNIKVNNVTTSDLVYDTSVDDFNSKDESGSPQILLDSNLPRSISIKSWLQTIPTFSLNTRQAKTIVASITIPNDAEPGGHYGVLRFAGRSPELDSTGVGLSASAGALILVRVAGDITEQGELVSFTTENSGSTTWFFENSPIKLVARVKNTGDIHIKPSGNIVIKNIFGNVVSTLDINADRGNVLPDSIRRFESTASGWMFGYYSATVALGYGNNGQVITGTTSFWVIPYKLILAVLLIGVTLIYVLTKLIKAYNRRIIAKAQNEKTDKKSHKSKK